ncbi:hypothetical protein SBF1_7010004 [Candidatus Desulfosporosinus infrequens]|uniref:Putative Se/S carrier protein-like domain-containing protein n=1 Tax=Candidatus Desulfosporosinus infrequens TaxID=2043169 RepID=A0A2U3LPM4_9FIRM|nr:hypothetical protein SBF1_7010004 [Candidatus Desulfosporosinus infrequens]
MYLKYDRLLSFGSVHHAMRAEKLLTAAEIKIDALPTPREIDISCGECILFMAADQQRVIKILDDHQVRWTKLFKCNMQDRVHEEIESR